MAKTRNPQDATRRNVQAANKQFATHDAALEQLADESTALKGRLVVLEQNVAHALDRLTNLEARLGPTVTGAAGVVGRVEALERRLDRKLGPEVG